MYSPLDLWVRYGICCGLSFDTRVGLVLRSKIKEGPPHGTWVRLFIRFMGSSNRKGAPPNHTWVGLDLRKREEPPHDTWVWLLLSFTVSNNQKSARHHPYLGRTSAVLENERRNPS